MRVLIALFLQVILLQTSLRAQQTDPLFAVLNAEKAFAKLAFEKDMKTAFLANMNDSSLIEMQGKLVHGLPVYLHMQPDPAGKLIWRPVFAAVSSAGDLGYTTGPYTYTVHGKAVAFGDFATVWRRDSSNSWKFVIDLGNSHDRPLNDENTELVLPALKISRKTGNQASLLAADQAFTADINKMALDKHVHVLHDAKPAAIGNAALAELKTSSSAYQFKMDGFSISESKDLGVVYGYCVNTRKPEEKGVYMHVWRMGENGRWQLLHETIKCK